MDSKGQRTKLEAHAVKCIFVGYDEEDRSGFADRVLAALPDERQRLCGCHHCDDHLVKATASVEAILRDEDAVTKDHLRRRQRRTGEVTYSTSSGTNSRRRTGEVTYSTSSGTEQIRELSASEAIDNQALPRTSEVIGASEASAAFGEQRTSASQLEQPIQAGSAQVGETLLPVIIESGDDRTVVPQRAVSPRSGEIARTRTDHPSTWSVEAHTHGTTIGYRSEIQSHNEGHPTSVDASRSQADVHRQPTQSGHVRFQSNPIASTRSRELPVLDERAVEWFQQFIADEVNKRLHNDKDSGQMSFLSRERGSCVPSHSNHYNYKIFKTYTTLCVGVNGTMLSTLRPWELALESARHFAGNVPEGKTVWRPWWHGLLKVAGIPGRVSVLEVPSTCSQPSEEDVVLDYLRTSGIESRQDHVKYDRDLPSYEQFVYALLVIKCVTDPQTYKQAIASGEAAQWGKAMDSEIQSHEDNETWVLVPRPKGRNVLNTRWVYVIKNTESITLKSLRRWCAWKSFGYS
ncbi:unnamed protein product [Phytophthora fragariaefolia]|uniref:Unnamed protein product n=1 Tax=Phytophthora fragariaefolia TaxID=1490495 RepID=A0A9W6YPV0_9STRA|nr:unnamed protein product [Phytophthora fragariaefolia]